MERAVEAEREILGESESRLEEFCAVCARTRAI